MKKDIRLYSIFALGRILQGSIWADRQYLKILYKYRMGKKLNLENPQTFNEKLQWLKIYDRNPEYTKMVDKYEAKKYVEDIIGEQYIIPTLGVWDKFEDIDFDTLPNEFVLKCTHDSGGLVICKDKSKFDIESARKKINHCLKRNYFKNTREWVYKDIKPRIIAEQYMTDDSKDGLRDYKFYVINGKVEFLYISEGLQDHATAKISFVTKEWEFAPFRRSDYRSFEKLPKKPVNFDKMIILAEKIANNACFRRIDFYEIEEKICFSEITFTPCGGVMPFEPEEWDCKLGGWIDLNNFCKKET